MLLRHRIMIVISTILLLVGMAMSCVSEYRRKKAEDMNTGNYSKKETGCLTQNYSLLL